MKPPAKALSSAERERKLKELRHDIAERRLSYRARALALFPHVCASCGREFDGKRLRELTVHHKDHDHTQNPPDGSNWELLCVYCHDHEHEKFLMKGHGGATADKPFQSTADFSPFANLDQLLTPEKPTSQEAGRE